MIKGTRVIMGDLPPGITLKYDGDLTNLDIFQNVPFRERPRERNMQKPHENEKMGTQPV